MATGPSGFVERIKGKVAQAVGGLYVGGVQVNATGLDQNTAVGTGTVYTSTGSSSSTAAYIPTTISAGFGLKRLQPTSTQPIFRLPPPVQGGGWTTIVYSTVNGSTGLILTISTDGSVVFEGVGSSGSTASFAGSGGSTLSNCLKSTQSHQIELQSISTAKWLFAGVVPSTVAPLTFSTSS
jgi:hypothetical protein